MPNDIRILVGVPTMGSIHPTLASRLILWGKRYTNIGFYFSYKIAPVDRARNQIVKQFLDLRVGEDKQPFTHLFFIDSDTIPPVDAIERLLSHDKDVVSGLTPILSLHQVKNKWESYDNCFVAVEDKDGEKITHVVGRHTGLHEIFRCGASCLLIKREVFEKIQAPYFEFITNEDNTLHVRSEDINFCDKVHEAGMEIYADSDVVCDHVKEIQI